jgi:microsomal dipeptidase-like Zn-dependent dipeptidase
MPFDVTGIPLITEALIRAGFSDRAIGQIMGGNVEHLFSVTLPE